MKYKRIPFNLELAKAITKGEKEGRVVTRDGNPVRIICWDAKDKDFPIVGLIDVGKREISHIYKNNGSFSYDTREDCHDLFLEVPDEQEFKEGCVIVFRDDCGDYLSILKSITDTAVNLYALTTSKQELLSYGIDVHCNIDAIRLATPEERQQLIDVLKKDNSDKAREYLKRFFGIETGYKFEPFDKVLVKDFSNKNCHQDVWKIGHFEYFDEKDNTYHVEGIYGGYNCCIPYNEQTKHLLGTTDDWEG